MRIALVEDDPDLIKLMSMLLEGDGHNCRPFSRGDAALKALQKETFDLVILDWILPDIQGDEILKWIRKHLDWPIPVLFVTQRDREEDIVYALEHGADDYLTKPIKQLELVARVKALGRRSTTEEASNTQLDFGIFHFDFEKRSIDRGNEAIVVTEKEFELAAFIFRNAGRMLSRAHLLESVWGRSAAVNTRTVDTHMSRLRKKLALTPADSGWRLNAIYQHGYRLERIDAEMAA